MQEFLLAESSYYERKADADTNRLSFHLMPMTGWLNDPNGLHQKDGEYHIFYQYSPQNATGAGLKGWGHYTTRDWIHYVQQPIALFPDSDRDFGGAYSGSAYVEDGKVTYFYTGNGKLPGPYDYINEGRQHWVISFDGSLPFPILPEQKQVILKNEDYPDNLSCHVRDPLVYKEGDTYYMVLGSRTKAGVGQINLFSGKDLTHFEPCSVISTQTPFGYMWECPNLFDVDGHRVLIICPQGMEQQGYQYENKDGNGYFFVTGPLDQDQTVSDFQVLDYGFDFYAPQVFTDEQGRVLLIGWMGIPNVPYTCPTIEAGGWQHALTMPRQLHVKDNQLYQYPVEEFLQLRQEEIPVNLQPDRPMELPTSVFELQLEVTCPFVLQLRKDTLLSWDGSLLTLDVTASGYGRTARHIEMDQIHSLHIFSDTSSLEIFINQGQKCLTTRVYDDQSGLKLESNVPMQGILYPLSGFEIEMGYLPAMEEDSSGRQE